MLLSPYSTSTLQGAIPPPTTHWRFNQTAILPSEITFTRAGNASVFNQAGALETASTNVHRFDYNPATTALRGWLMEESRSNDLSRSSEMPGEPWVFSAASGVADTATAPDGTLTADELRTSTGTSTHFVYQSVPVTAGLTYTFSRFVKKKDYRWCGLAIISAPLFGISNIAYLDLDTGVVTSGGGAYESVRVTDAGNGWWHLAVTATAIASGSTTGLRFYNAVPTGTGTGTATFDGAANLGSTWTWGAQFGQGSFPTSHIPTAASGATRPAETAIISGGNFASLFDASRGAVLIDADVLGWPGGTATPPALVSLHADINNRMQLRYSPTGQGNLRVVSGGVSVTDVNVSIPGNPLRRRGLMTWGDGMCRMYSNGILIAEAASVPSVNQVQIGGGPGSGNASAHIREMMIWRNTALTFQQAMQLSAQVF